MGPSRDSWVLIWLLRLAASDCAGAMVLQELTEDMEAMEISDGRIFSSDGTGLIDSSLTWPGCTPSLRHGSRAMRPLTCHLDTEARRGHAITSAMQLASQGFVVVGDKVLSSHAIMGDA